MTTTATATAAAATKAKATIEDAKLAKAWADISHKMTRTSGLIAKHTDALKIQRVYAGRIVREVMGLDSFRNKQGNIVKARVAEALGLSTTEGKRFIASVELVDHIMATHGTVSLDGEDVPLELGTGEPTRAEIEAYNAPWTGNAKKMRDVRADKSAKSADKSSDVDTAESAPVADSVALSFNDLVVKMKELENTINALKLAGVELSDSERELANNILADISAAL